jgi:hypothetical protein
MNQCWIIYILKRFTPADKMFDALFPINDFKNRIDGCSIMDTVDLRVPTKQII